MNEPNDFPLPDMSADTASVFPELAVDHPALRTYAALPFPVEGLGDGKPAGDAMHFSPPVADQEKAPADPAPAAAEQANDTPAFDPSLLATLATDPIAKRELDFLRAQAVSHLAVLTDQACAMLTPDDKPQSSAQLASGPANIRTLMAASRNSAMNSRSRRELAEALVIGSVINLDNPNWDPADAATSTSGEKNLLSALLQMES